MKRVRGLLSLMLLSGSLAFGQAPSPFEGTFSRVQITSFDRGLALHWTNLVCTENPVYEVLKAHSPTGRWEHVSFVSNRAEVVIDDPSAASSIATFYRIGWTSDQALNFDYAFDEGYGLTAVTGRLVMTFFSAPSAGTWTFGETEYAIDQEHPVGTGVLWGGAIKFGNVLKLELKTIGGGCVDCGFYLEGVLEQGVVNGKCTYVSYSGTVFENTFGGPFEIGTFVAIRE